MPRKIKKILALFLSLVFLLTNSPTFSYELTNEERELLEQVVMAEASTDFFGQALIAECALNTAIFNDLSINDVLCEYKWTKNRADPSESAIWAVKSVFDYGYSPSKGAGITIFYNPFLIDSDYHESQNFVLEWEQVRFFSENRFLSLIEKENTMNNKRRTKINDIIKQVNVLIDVAETILYDEQDAYDNLPEGIQSSDRGEAMEKAIENLESAIASLSEASECFNAAQNGD